MRIHSHKRLYDSQCVFVWMHQGQVQGCEALLGQGMHVRGRSSGSKLAANIIPQCRQRSPHQGSHTARTEPQTQGQLGQWLDAEEESPSTRPTFCKSTTVGNQIQDTHAPTSNANIHRRWLEARHGGHPAARPRPSPLSERSWRCTREVVVGPPGKVWNE